MRLIKLEISGFKSFVDATEIRLPSDLTAVVGPNGCGKSNIIDAVRWVMGEASARTLRGDSMSDVIFNGSSARRPVGKAAVELLFDNSDNSAGGSFEKFAEISVKRTLSRDGQSGYFINNIKTRRRDVLDLFRGTGLGPRSYSIIEQGMVSRIVEARPEDLRLFVEEAAGTSKYKDRRRETETRIAHTRENLSRVADIRDELDKQLRRLKRQVSSAKRYRELRDEHRVVKAQLMMLQLRDMEADLEARGREQEKHQNALQEATDAARAAENEAEQLRRQQSEAREAHHGAERDLLALDANIKNLEQRVAHLGAESARLRERSEAREQQLESTRGRLRELRNEESQFAPRAEQLAQARRAAAEQMETAESDMETWRNEWEQFTMQSQQPEREREVQEARIEQVEQRLARGAADLERREKELAGLREAQAAAGMDELREEARAHDETCERAERELAQGEEARHALRERARQLRELGEAARARLHQTESRLASLREIQEAALDSGDAALRDWLAARGFADAPKLAERIDVADGWERAADRLLGNFLGALCVNKLPRDALAERPDRAFMLMEASATNTGEGESSRPRLLDKIQIDGADLSALLDGVYAADSLEAALEMQPQLSGRECAVTRDGALVGANWVSFASSSQLATGVLVREEEMQQLQRAVEEAQSAVESGARETAEVETQHQAQRDAVQKQRETREKLRRENAELRGKLARAEERHAESEARITALGAELEELAAHVKSDRDDLARARELLERAAGARGELETRRAEMERRRAELQDAVAKRRAELQRANEERHAHALQQQRVENEIATAVDDIARLERESSDAQARLAGLHSGGGGESEAELQKMQGERARAEAAVSAAAENLAGFDARIQEAGARRDACSEALENAREALSQHQLAHREAKTRHDVQADVFAREDHTREELAASLPPEADAAALEARDASLQQKLDRIGAVNLVAIDEFDEQNERKEYLDRQHADLSESLDTLRSAIRKIDRETRERFKETYDRLNAGFNEFFPKLFGGGSAELRLTEDDFLTAGIVVMARPPGKRNSHIHLLSGGEKALTAVALLFALFRLNPAPFCMLDEVDAPLDDANVQRYCSTLKSLVKVSQMIVITHNKITMESADVLLGVTMGEPGVSRLVSVDVEQAVEMAAQ